ncbi:MAG TPA: acyl-CoA thioesterase domain-containing protein [Acidimicrobiia bacterium]|nr:acyl-CoA thioesterase domain-containing protein [Acidimicrobiia bacterium]
MVASPKPAEPAAPAEPAEPAELPRAETMEELLDLEELDRDLYRAHNPRRPFTDHLYGGQVAAQALRAAGLTVPEARYPHSLHGYYLRPGEAEHPTIMKVSRDRDGRSFSARRVEALQRGQAIFTASMSFHIDEESGDHSAVPLRDDMPSPEELVDHVLPGSDVLMEMRTVDPPPADVARQSASRFMWARTRERLPDDRVLHAAAIVYLSDMSTGFADLEVPNLPKGGSSLDHTVYFHRPARADEWMFMALEPVSAAGARGVYRGSVHDRSGVLLATLVQENLMRPWPDGA